MTQPNRPFSQANATPPHDLPEPALRARAPLGARGEPMVWLMGGGAALAVLMIVLLLGYILYRGATTFWPSPVVQVTLRDGKVVMGEPTRSEAAGGEGQSGRRTLYRTGNYDVTGTDFTWVADTDVARTEHPPWAMTVEREAWGWAYGTIEKVIVDGVETTGAEPAWKKFQEVHGPMRTLEEELTRLRARDVGAVSAQINEMDLELKGVGNRQGKDSPAYAAREAALAPRRAALQAQYAALQKRADEIVAKLDTARVVIRTAQGQLLPADRAKPDVPMRVAQVVRIYPANQLGVAGKTGVYASRWWEYLAAEPREHNTEGGVFPAIIGTVLMTFIMVLVAVPVGVIAAIYLREYAKQGWVVSLVRICVNNLAGVPSIVFGVFGVGFFIYGVGGFIDGGPQEPIAAPRWWLLLYATTASGLAGAAMLALGWGVAAGRGKRAARWATPVGIALMVAFGVGVVVLVAKSPFFHGFFPERLPSPTIGKTAMLWASLTLSLLTLPVVIVATEEALSAVPGSLREASYGAGATKWQTIWRVVLPRAYPGIMTGAILAIARGAGEVAPLMLVGAVKIAPQLPISTEAPFFGADRSFMHLGFHIFDLGFQSRNSEAAKPMVYTTTLLLIAIVLLLNLAAMWLRARLRRSYVDGHF